MALTEKQLEEFRKFLSESQKPLFFFDDDPDGLSSFLLLRKKAGKGYGIPLKKGPGSDSLILRKINEIQPDTIFFLDVAVLEQSLLDQINVPVVWLDHHPFLTRDRVNYFNPRHNDPNDNRCTSYWAHRVVQENDWIAAVGIIADWGIPDFLDRFEYKDLIGKPKNPGEAYFETQYSPLIKVFSFLLKGTVTEVKNNINTLMKVEGPLEILNQTTPKGKFLWKHYEDINREYENLAKKARTVKPEDNLFLFVYPTKMKDISFTSLLSNEMLHRYGHNLVIIAREKHDTMILSLRSATIPVLPLLEKALKEVRGYGGGHLYACGAGINKDDFPKFIDIMKEGIKQK